MAWEQTQDPSKFDPETYSTFSTEEILPGSKRGVWGSTKKAFSGMSLDSSRMGINFVAFRLVVNKADSAQRCWAGIYHQDNFA